MSAKPNKIYFSFFMFTADLDPTDKKQTEVLIDHMLKIQKMGYDGFDLHIPPKPPTVEHKIEVEQYRHFKEALNQAGLKNLSFCTNVGTTPTFDPTSPYAEQGELALSYLKSRVDITHVLGGDGSIISGPFLYPYGDFPITDLGEPIWSDALVAWMKPRYQSARPVFEELAKYAKEKRVQLSIEPVKNWETPAPNRVYDVLEFLDSLTGNDPCGVTIDTAQCLMENQGPEVFKSNVRRAIKKEQLNYVHISAPDRGAIRDCWIPWDVMLSEIAPVYKGPYLIEVFNAINPLDSGMRLTRPRFWRPGQDAPTSAPSAYEIAQEAIETFRHQLSRF